MSDAKKRPYIRTAIVNDEEVEYADFPGRYDALDAQNERRFCEGLALVVAEQYDGDVDVIVPTEEDLIFVYEEAERYGFDGKRAQETFRAYLRG